MFLLPTLNRPEGVKRFFDAYETSGGTTAGQVIVDHNDYKRNQQAYDYIKAYILPNTWTLYIGNEITMGDKMNMAFWRFRNTNSFPLWIGMVQDDMVPETQYWDQILSWEVTIRGRHLISCAEGWQDEKRIRGAHVWSTELVRALGWIFPPKLPHLFNDDMWETIASRVPDFWHRRMDVMVRSHHVLRTGIMDSTHLATYERSRYESAKKRWEDIRDKGELDEIVDKVRRLVLKTSITITNTTLAEHTINTSEIPGHTKASYE